MMVVALFFVVVEILLDRVSLYTMWLWLCSVVVVSPRGSKRFIKHKSDGGIINAMCNLLLDGKFNCVSRHWQACRGAGG